MYTKHTEIRFEEAIEEVLTISGGFKKGDPTLFDSERALFSNDFIAFKRESQEKKWNGLQQILGNRSEETLIIDLYKELTAKGALNVFRHGFKCFGKLFKLAFFTPNSKMNKQAWIDYEKNLLTVTRQVHFSPKNPDLSIDVVSSLNGLPIVTMELKNPMTGQNILNAINQERFGTDFTLADQLFFDQVIETALEDEKIREAAKVNSIENFMYFFEKMLEGLFIERMDGNEEIFTKLMNDENMMKAAAQQVGRDVYSNIHKS